MLKLDGPSYILPTKKIYTGYSYWKFIFEEALKSTVNGQAKKTANLGFFDNVLKVCDKTSTFLEEKILFHPVRLATKIKTKNWRRVC